MQILKNIVVGFLVSFIGSIPFGYLNIVGFNVYRSAGLNATIQYLLGVVVIEFIVVLITLIFAKKLTANPKLIQFIEAFSILFMFVLGYVFFANSNSDQLNRTISSNVGQHFFVVGILLSSSNFIQVPFWTSWNLYLLNGKHIEISHSRQYFYVFGTITGTFFGMLVLILSLIFLTVQADFFSKYLIQIIIPLVFVASGAFQAHKYYRKYIIFHKKAQ
jgi:threonine/homoserine/homoserine lactone efflux protein